MFFKIKKVHLLVSELYIFLHIFKERLTHCYTERQLSYVRAVGIHIIAVTLLVQFVWLTSYN